MRRAPLHRDWQWLGDVEIADGVLSRARGLLGRRTLDGDRALLLSPCAAIHTFGMRFAIDVLFLNGDGVIVSLAARLPPWRWARGQGASVTIEWAAGAIDRYDFARGQRLRWTSA